MSEYLSRLRALTERLNGLDQIPTRETGSVAIMEVEGGTVFVFTLLSVYDIQVLHAFMPHGVKFPEHVHPTSTELLMVTEGELSVEYDRDGEWATKVLQRTEAFCAPAGLRHRAEPLQDTWVLVVAVVGKQFRIGGVQDAP